MRVIAKLTLLLVLLSSAAPIASTEWPSDTLPAVKDAPSAKGANLPHPIPDITLSAWETSLVEARLSNRYQVILINRALVEEWSSNVERWDRVLDERRTVEYLDQWWRRFFRPKASDVGADAEAPVVTAFTIPSTASSLTVSVSSFTATDNTAVTGYLINESASAPSESDPGWSGSPQSLYVFSTEGAKTLYAWAKDAAGNISSSVSDTVTITLDPELVHWVSPTGAADWEDCFDDVAMSGTAACSMAEMNLKIDAGQTAKLRGGTYNEQIRPTHSGTASSRITIQTYTGETVTVTNVGGTKPGLDLDGASYITVRGESVENKNLVIYDNYMIAWLQNGASYNEVAYADLSKGTGPVNNGINILTLPAVTELTANRHNWFHHNKIHEGGAVTLVPSYDSIFPTDVGCDDSGGLISVGGDNAIDGLSTNNSFTDNEIYFGAHHAIKFNTRYNVAVNNFIHNEGSFVASVACQTTVVGDGDPNPNFRGTCTEAGPWGDENLYGNRGLTIVSTHKGAPQWVGDTYNLLEGNRFANSGLPSDGNGGDGFTMGGDKDIGRFNESYNNAETGLYVRASGDPGDNNHIYNNTFANNGHGTCRIAQGHSGYWKGGIRIPGTADNNAIKNNLFYGNYNANQSGQTREFFDGGAGTVKAKNWTTTTSVNGEPGLNGDPQFVDATYPSGAPSRTQPDLTPQNPSIINGGTSLTLANGAGVSTTTLVVDDALYFQDGTRGSSLAGHEADWIAIGTVDNVVQIDSINYATNTITLKSAKTWSDNAPIWLYKDSTGTVRLLGTAPDIGAKEQP